MPELPEVETVRRDLASMIAGDRIEAVEVSGMRTVRRHGHPAPLLRVATGRRVDLIDRHGKYLLLRLERDAVLVVHLRMSGQLLLDASGRSARPRHTHVVLHLARAGELRFVDPRTFGEVFVTTAELPELAHIGPDALDGLESARQLAAMLSGRRRRIKDLLVDQGFVAGIGNIYSDEILWTARVRHDRRADELTRPQVARLFDAVRGVLTDAVAHRGSSLADQQYRDLYGRVGSYAEHHRVYARQGLPCPRCGRPIARIAYGGRSHFFCPRCQR